MFIKNKNPEILYKTTCDTESQKDIYRETDRERVIMEGDKEGKKKRAAKK